MHGVAQDVAHRRPVAQHRAQVEHRRRIGRRLRFHRTQAEQEQRDGQRSGPYPVVVREAWMLIPTELRGTARVRAVADWLIEVAEDSKAALLGRSRANVSEVD